MYAIVGLISGRFYKRGEAKQQYHLFLRLYGFLEGEEEKRYGRKKSSNVKAK